MNAVELAGADLNLLVVLAVLLEEGSVTRAAARLGRTQSAVSHSVNRLREVFGDPLFLRSGQRMLPTPRAESLRAPVADLTSRMLELLRPAPELDPSRSDRRFTLTASDYLQIVLVPPLIRRIRAAAPHVRVDVQGPKARLPERLSRGDFDFALAVYLDDQSSLYSKKLFPDRFVCLVAEDHPSVRRGLDLATYLRLDHVLISPLGGATGHVDQALSRTGQSRRIAVLVPDFMVAPRLLPGTDLILTLPERVARLFPDQGLTVLPPPLDLPRISGHLVWHERLSRDPAAAWFRQMVEETSSDLDTPRAPKKRKS